MKKRKNKCCLAAGALVAAGLVWLLPMKAEAALCYEWEGPHYNYYCATPVCHRSIPSYFKEISWVRICMGENEPYKDYRVEKTDLGCCSDP